MRRQSELAAGRVRELQRTVEDKEEELRQLHSARADELQELDDKALVLDSLRKTVTDVATEREMLRETLKKQQQERDALHMQLQTALTNDERASLTSQQLRAALIKSEQEVTELQQIVERKNRSEMELLSQAQALQQSVSRLQTTEQELNAKNVQLQGAIDREKLHAQVQCVCLSVLDCFTLYVHEFTCIAREPRDTHFRVAVGCKCEDSDCTGDKRPVVGAE